jgi:hypothetical protein
MAVQVPQVLAHRGVDPGAVAAQQRLGEPAERHAAGQVGHRGEAHLGGLDQVLEGESGALAERVHRRWSGQPLPQQIGHDRDVGRHPLLRQEDAEECGLQLGVRSRSAMP